MSSTQWFTRSAPTVSCLSIANATFNFVPTPSTLATRTGSRMPGKVARNSPPNPPIFPSTCGPCVCLTSVPMPRFNLFARSTSTPARAYTFFTIIRCRATASVANRFRQPTTSGMEFIPCRRKNFLKLFRRNLERRGKDIMKTPRFQISIVVAAAIGTIVLIVSSAQANPLRKFGRFRSSERDAPGLTTRNLETSRVHHPAPQVPLRSGYPRYRLVDLGTLGGPNSGVWGASTQLNNRGEVIAQLGTPFADPYDPNCLNFDCFVWHGVVGKTNGVVTDLGALPGVNSSAPV